MIYGVANRDKCELIIAAADSYKEHALFLQTVEQDTPELVQDTDFTRYLVEEGLVDYKKPPTILEFSSADALDAFVAQNNITLVENRIGVDQQSNMLTRMEFDVEDTRTIAEIFGIPKEALDSRTEEEKAKDAAMRKKQEEGDITGSSFDDVDEKGGLAIHGWGKPVIKEDGTVEFGDILADKDMFALQTYHLVLEQDEPDAYMALLKRAGLLDNPDRDQEWFKHPTEAGVLIKTSESGYANLEAALSTVPHTLTHLDNPEMATADARWKIADDYLVLTYYRVDLRDQPLDPILQALAEAKLREPPFSREVADFGSWLAFVREFDASRALNALTERGFSGEIVAVDPMGIRILEEGTEHAVVLDAARDEIEPPFPWNDRADEYAALSAEQQRKLVIGKYFIFTMRDCRKPDGVVIHITPKSYFRTNQRIWEGEIDLSHLLGPNIERYGDAPGLYHCTTLDAQTVEHILENAAGIHQSLMLRAYANFLPKFDQRNLVGEVKVYEE